MTTCMRTGSALSKHSSIERRTRDLDPPRKERKYELAELSTVEREITQNEAIRQIDNN